MQGFNQMSCGGMGRNFGGTTTTTRRLNYLPSRPYTAGGRTGGGIKLMMAFDKFNNSDNKNFNYNFSNN